MKKINLFSILFAVLLLPVCLISVSAQEVPPADAPDSQVNQQPRPNLMQTLGLTPEQRQQIRKLNQENRLQLRAAQDRLREANKMLDMAIYADVPNDVEMQTRLKEAQTAQIAVIRIRSLTEFAVRKILTPEQLAKFREIRRQFSDKLNLRQNQLKNRINRFPMNQSDLHQNPEPPKN